MAARNHETIWDQNKEGESMSKVKKWTPKRFKELKVIASILSEPLACCGLGEHIACCYECHKRFMKIVDCLSKENMEFV
jgi:hypothetical protein